MSGLSTLLETARRALMAQQVEMSVTGHNIANASTAGYSRQRVNLVETPALRESYGFLGTGVVSDQITRLRDSFLLVIDYKSGNVSPTSWELPRPDDVQLPLYAGFALKPGDMLGGLVFAKVRAVDREFAGQLLAPAATLFAGLKGTSPLAKNKLTLDQLLEWRDCIEQLARDFLDGKAAVNPRGPREKTCERCGLQTLCRIQEHPAQLAAEDDSDSPDFSEAANE